MKVKQIPDRFGVMAFDPGTTSAVARAVLTPQDTLRETMAASEDWETWEVKGPTGAQAMEIATEFVDWQFDLHMVGIPTQFIWLVSEQFQMRPSKARGAGSDPHMLDPIRVMSGVDTLMWKRDLSEQVKQIEFQMPGLAKGYATNDRLREWGAWVVGSEHRRDANRHLLYKVNMVISGKFLEAGDSEN